MGKQTANRSMVFLMILRLVPALTACAAGGLTSETPHPKGATSVPSVATNPAPTATIALSPPSPTSATPIQPEPPAGQPQMPLYASLPRWRGFNILEKFTLAGNQPYQQWEFDAIAEWGFNFVRLPMDYPSSILQL